MVEKVRQDRPNQLIRFGDGNFAKGRKLIPIKEPGKKKRIRIVMEPSSDLIIQYNLKREDLDDNGFFIWTYDEEMVVQLDSNGDVIQVLCGVKEEPTKLTEIHELFLKQLKNEKEKNLINEIENEKLRYELKRKIESMGYDEEFIAFIREIIRETMIEVMSQNKLKQGSGGELSYNG